MSTHIHQEVFIKATPSDVYSAFMDDTKHSVITGGPSNISSEIGGLAKMHDGQILARNLELEPGIKIVQAWRVANWEDGVYTLLRVTFTAENGGTRITLDQTGCPPDMTDHLAQGWEARYWGPFKEFFEA